MMNWYITFALVCTLRGLTCDVGSNTTTTQITTDDLSDVNGTYVRAELEKEFYLQSLFNKYGQNGVLKVSGLRQIFVNIGLTSTPVSHVHIGDKQDSAHLHSHDRNVINHVHQRSSDPLIYFKKREVQTHADEHGEKSNHVEHRECLGVDELLHVYHFRDNRSITHEDFVSLCPGLITLLDREICGSTNWIAIDSAAHEHRELADIPSSVWGYSSLAILVISLVGLLGVAVIPVMQKVFYNHLLQFLVALAVGALSGDALLHLIPHALAGEHEPHDETSEESMAEKLEEQKNVMKGLVGLTGIYAFFLIERIMTIATDLKRKRQEEKHRKKKLEYANELGEAEIKEVEAQLPVLHDHACHNDCGHMEFGIHPGNKALEQFAEEAHRDQYEEQVLEEKLQSMHSLDKIGISDSKKEKDEEIGHGHGHSHGHSHGQLPEGVAAIAWMVILGDGIHNFSDGLAIGAAFSNSITGGISTSIAVFCHELPHEIGDFAVLLKAGMKVNQAVMYNVVSSILAFVGMLIGVVIGNISEASVWIFAIVGGMFLYIALVDMLPQMMSVKTKDGENPFHHLLFQVGGMIVGIGIMLLIGLFEEDLKTMLE